MANKKLNFAIDRFELIEDAHNSQLAKMKFYVCRNGNNLHNLPIEWETINNAAHTLVGKPILTNYIGYKDDFGSHDSEQIPVGCFISENDIKEEKDDEDNTWLTAIGFVWRKYFPEVFNVIERNERTEGTRVSMEIELVGDDNEEKINNFAFMGLTMLGKNVQPAIPNARGLLSFSALVEQTEKIVFGSGYRGISFEIPESVKKNSEKGLSLYAEYKRGGNPYHLATARHLTSNTKTEPSRIKKLYQSLKNKSKQDLEDKTGDGHIGFMLLGGNECMKFCKELMTEMENADSNKLSHFTLNAGNSTETEDIKLKKKEFEDKEEEVKEPVEKMADEKKEDEKPFAQDEVEEEDGKGKPFAEEKPTDEKEEKEKPFAETPEEEKKEPASEEKEETPSEEDSEEARMSLNSYADVTAQLAMLGMETKSAEELSASVYATPKTGEQFSILLSKVKELYSQNITLKEYKVGIEKAQFAHMVESTLAEVSEIMPKAKLEECRLNSAKFTLETVTGWQNEVKALAFSFAKDGKLKKEDDGIIRYALAWRNEEKKEEAVSSLWRGN